MAQTRKKSRAKTRPRAVERLASNDNEPMNSDERAREQEVRAGNVAVRRRGAPD